MSSAKKKASKKTASKKKTKKPDVRIPPHETEGSWSIGDLEKRKKKGTKK